jgi:hypothetical protein
MAKLARAIDLNFGAEKDKALAQLHDLNNVPELAAELHLARARISMRQRPTLDGIKCGPESACRTQILAKIGRELCGRTWLVGHNGSLRSGIPSDFRREPSPEGRGGKMLEETALGYSFLFLALKK